MHLCLVCSSALDPYDSMVHTRPDIQDTVCNDTFSSKHTTDACICMHASSLLQGSHGGGASTIQEGTWDLACPSHLAAERARAVGCLLVGLTETGAFSGVSLAARVAVARTKRGWGGFVVRVRRDGKRM